MAAAPASEHRGIRLRKHVEEVGLRIVRPRPASSLPPSAPGEAMRRERAVELAHRRRREQRTDRVLIVLHELDQRSAACSSGVKSIRSSRVNALVVVGRRLVGIGCVGEYHSPGTSPCGTGLSSIGQIGLPVGAIEDVEEAPAWWAARPP